jgi:hypothetical protein
MINVTRQIDQELEVDVLALQALSSPSQLLSAELGALGGTCDFGTVCCGTVICGQTVGCGQCTAVTNICTGCTLTIG